MSKTKDRGAGLREQASDAFQATTAYTHTHTVWEVAPRSLWVAAGWGEAAAKKGGRERGSIHSTSILAIGSPWQSESRIPLRPPSLMLLLPAEFRKPRHQHAHPLVPGGHQPASNY